MCIRREMTEQLFVFWTDTIREGVKEEGGQFVYHGVIFIQQTYMKWLIV